MTVGTVTGGTVAVRTGTDAVILGTETVTKGTVGATRARGNAAESTAARERAWQCLWSSARCAIAIAPPGLSRLATGMPLIATNSNRPLGNEPRRRVRRRARRTARTLVAVLPDQMVADVTIAITVGVDDPRAAS